VSFDRVAPHYRTLEKIAFGGALQRARHRWMTQLPPRRRALIVGEGDGGFLEELCRAQPDLEIDCVDESARMLELARERTPAHARVRFICQDVLCWQPVGTYDLLVTHFVLDCFSAPEIEVIVAKLARAAASDTIWLLADFAVPEERWSNLHARAWLQAMYAFFRLAADLRTRQLVDATPYLRENGFRRDERELSRAGMLKSEMWTRES
jgi:ubiquinone/menaquinone biosynthesis C-methylase UbiE